MTCSHCRHKIAAGDARCPNCGKPNRGAAGTFQTSTVLISTGGAERVYRSVDEVPPRLRTRLLKSTNGANSATILIADRRGRQEIAQAMRRTASPRQRRLASSLLAAEAPPERVVWLTPRRRMALMALIAIAVVLLVALLFTHRWQ
jgi:hypothetical protein